MSDRNNAREVAAPTSGRLEEIGETVRRLALLATTLTMAIQEQKRQKSTVVAEVQS